MKTKLEKMKEFLDALFNCADENEDSTEVELDDEIKKRIMALKAKANKNLKK
jgi:hypothetical protein